MSTIDNLYLINLELLVYKQNNKFIPSNLPKNVTSVFNLDNFEIDPNGSQLIVFLLKTKLDSSGESAVLILQKNLNNKFTKIFPEDFNYDRGYYVHGLQIIGVPGIKLSNISVEKKKLFQNLAIKYSKEKIDLGFISQILEVTNILTDNELINQIILDKLEVNDLINLTLLSLDNKNIVNNYILNVLKTKYNLDSKILELDKLQPIKLYEQISKFDLLTETTANWAVKNNYLQLLVWLSEKNVLPDMSSVNYAAQNGNLEILNWLFEKGILPNMDTAGYAAFGGYINILEWLIMPPRKYILNENAANRAARGDQLNVLIWLSERGIFPRTRGIYEAVANGHIHILKWAFEKDTLSVISSLSHSNIQDVKDHIADEAATYGRLEILQWLAEPPRNILPSIQGIDNAAADGYIKVLEWLGTKGKYPSTYGISYAARSGHLNILKWISEKTPLRYKFPGQWGVDDAARAGEMEVLEWLAMPPRNILPGKKGADLAAENGHLNVLIWLANKNILPTEEGIAMAIKNNHDNVIKWWNERKK